MIPPHERILQINADEFETLRNITEPFRVNYDTTVPSDSVSDSTTFEELSIKDDDDSDSTEEKSLNSNDYIIQYKTVPINSPLIFKCPRRGGQVSWHFYNQNHHQTISNAYSNENGIYLSANREILQIQHAKHHHIGDYVCITNHKSGSITRLFHVNVEQKPYEQNHKKYNQNKDCNTDDCENDDETTKLFSEWSDWTSCSKKCGPGQKTRRRICKSKYRNKCIGSNFEVMPCEIRSCYSRRDRLLYNSQFHHF